MTLSPKKYTSNFTSSTTNRGVEAKEIEIIHTNLDVRACSDSGGAGGVIPRGATPPPSLGDRDDSASYIQVEVRRTGRGLRLPHTSSPARAQPVPPPPPHPPPLATMETVCAHAASARAAGVAVVAPALPAPAAACVCAGPALWRAAGGAGDAAPTSPGGPREKKHASTFWQRITDYVDDDDNIEGQYGGGGPERLEVYYFEQGPAGGEYLAGAGGREAAVERWARAAGRRAGALLAELGAAPGLAAGAVTHVVVGVERAVLRVVRDAGVGALQSGSDLLLKPALALLFNALLQPPLLLLRNVLRAARAALRPGWAALGDALAPAAALLANLRLVHVHIDRRTTCTHAL